MQPIQLVISSTTGMTPGQRAVVVITTEMPQTGTAPAANTVVFDQEFTGAPMVVSIVPGQYLTITPFVG